MEAKARTNRPALSFGGVLRPTRSADGAWYNRADDRQEAPSHIAGALAQKGAAMACGQVSDVVSALKSGRPAVFPTDTVYGLGVAVDFADGPEELFAIKRRPEGKPVAWLVGGVEDLVRYGSDVPEGAIVAAERFWPGSLTLVVKASEHVPARFRSPEGTIGLRMPASPTALAVIAAVGCPLAATSANISGEPAPNSYEEVDARILERATSCAPGTGERAVGLASTVLDCTGAVPRVLREGSISLSDVLGSPAGEGVCTFVPSVDESRRIRALAWNPCGPCKGIVHILHGMAEHAGRYDAFARYLSSAGFAVVAHDHIGHGPACRPGDLGHIPLDEGAAAMLSDVDAVRAFALGRFGEVPYVVFGHSMGSYLARAWAADRGSQAAGLALCGTGQVSPALSMAGRALARTVCALRGERAPSRLLRSLADGAFSRKVPSPRTPFDWICTDDAVVDAYLADPFCGFPFKASGYAALTDLTLRACVRTSFGKVPRDLPVLLIAGALDPVGDCGVGPRAVAAAYREAGLKDVACTVYPRMRHEVLNEPGHEEVFADVVRWLEDSCLGGKESR